jgi:hypothetical protein
MLGLGIGAGSILASGDATTVEDYFWELDGAGFLKPLTLGVTDFNETWDLDGTDYMPHTTTTVLAEGYWELDGTNIQPLDV